MGFTDGEIRTLIIFERLGGSLSLASVTLVFIAYAFFPRLRTVPNTFIVFASIANAGASAGSVIAYDGLFQGEASSLCQAQGFMFEFFIQSDPWWALAMAINVLLIFFTKTKPRTIKKWGWLYCLVCYGGPFIIALICLQLRDPNKSNVYGNAGLWCWITSDWGPLRIYSYYMLIWICILISMIIYIGVGIYVFRVRNRLHQVTGPGADRNVRGIISYSAPDGDVAKHPRSDAIYQGSTQMSTICSRKTEWLSLSREHIEGTVNVTTEVNVHIEHGALGHLNTPEVSRPQSTYRPRRHRNSSTGVETTISSLSDGLSEYGRLRTHTDSSLTARAAGIFDSFVVADPVKRAYLRTSLLFGISVLVTWIPSSINRIHGLLSNSSPYEYNLATATVLPLQGVWNGIIFFVTSWRVFKECVREWRSPGRRDAEAAPRIDSGFTRGHRRDGESEEELMLEEELPTKATRSRNWESLDSDRPRDLVLGLNVGIA